MASLSQTALRTRFRFTACVLALLLPAGAAFAQAATDAKRPPNVVLIFADDHGYSDSGPYNHPQGYDTPNIDALARGGMRLTDFYVATAVCSASRAALLTGTYPKRLGVVGALDHTTKGGLDPKEVTIAELLKQRGYATALFGKWHLGHRPEYLPVQQGFDEYFGLPYSNDMWPHHPGTPDYYPPLPLIDGTRTVETNPDQSQLTTWYTERSVDFIRRNREQPFFLYLAHSMPHVPLFVSGKFAGKTKGGTYGDVIAELDWSVGQVMATLKELGLEENTLVLFTSDNGPWLEYGDHAGSALPLRGGKGSSFEGGVRVPFVARWPGRIPEGAVSTVPAMTIDILPTIARVTGTALPSDRIIDGRDIWQVIDGSGQAEQPHEALFFYWLDGLEAVRSGRWKLHLPHPYSVVEHPGHGGKPGPSKRHDLPLSLYDMQDDASETTNVADQHPDVVQDLLTFAERARADMGDSLTERTGANLRKAEKTAGSF